MESSPPVFCPNHSGQSDSAGPALPNYTAQNIGAEKPDRVRQGALTGTLLSAGFVGILSFILFHASDYLSGFFISGADASLIVPMCTEYMKLMAPFFVFYAVGEAFSGVCCGLGSTVKPMVTTLVCVCLLRVVCIRFVLPSYSSMICIIWIYISSWIASGCAFTLMAYRRLRLKDNRNQ